MEIKPFQIILMAVFALTALVGIFLFANFQGFNTGVVPVGPVTIWGTLPERPMGDALNTLRQTHGELAKVTYVQKPADTFDTDLANAIAEGTGPDLIIISQEQLADNTEKLSPIPYSTISERTFRDTYLPESELFLSSKGSYGVPFVLDPLVMYYNRTSLQGVGAATPPSTWEAVAGIAPVLTRMDVGGSLTKSGVALGTYDNIENARAILSLLFLQAGYSVTARGTDGSLRGTLMSSPSSTQSTTGTTPAASAVSYYLQFGNPAKTTYAWNKGISSARTAFVAGDLALYFGFASEQPVIAAGNPNLDFDMAAMPVPGTAQTPMTYGRVYAFAIPKASHNAAGALRAANSLVGKDVLPALAKGLRMAPAQRALLSPSAGDLYEPVYFPQALVARGWLSPAPEKTDDLFATMIASVSSGRQSVYDALSLLDQGISAALR